MRDDINGFEESHAGAGGGAGFQDDGMGDDYISDSDDESSDDSDDSAY